MNAVLVPVRSLVGAKKRLANRLTVEEREALALAMLADMIGALKAARSVDRVVVVSADEKLLAHASEAGAEVLREHAPKGLNPAVTAAARTLEADGVTHLLTIPGDVPLLEPDEVDAVFASSTPQNPVVLVPSGTGTGTNGLLLAPPTIIEPRFEGLSLAAHRAVCTQAGIEPIVMRAPGFELDIDTPDDLAELARFADRGRCTHAAALASAAAEAHAIRDTTRAVS